MISTMYFQENASTFVALFSQKIQCRKMCAQGLRPLSKITSLHSIYIMSAPDRSAAEMIDAP
jgi:hypothetical protein